MRGFLRKSKLLATLFLSVFFAAPRPGFAEPGVFEDKIVFGQSAAFKGPAAALGNGMRAGILAAFNEVNNSGVSRGDNWNS